MEKKPRKRSSYKSALISEGSYQVLSQKYGFTTEELRTMAKELNMARPKLEMHLIYLTIERKKKTNS